MLFTPGPTTIPQRVLNAMSQPSVHHRTAEFEATFQYCREAFVETFGGQSAPVLLAASGSGALEATLRNTCNEKSTIAYLNGGKFGERWGLIANSLGVQSIELKCPWGESVSSQDFRKFLEENKPLDAICVQHSETSTGILHPVAEFQKIAKETCPEALFFVDAISSLLTAPLDISQYDGVIAGSQKALMLPPGLSFVSLSERAWQKVEKTNASSFYFDLEKERAAQVKGNSAWTPAISIILGLKEIFMLIQEEGLTNIFDRHLECSKVCRKGLKNLGFTLLANDYPAPGVTPALPPASLDAKTLPQLLFEKYGKRIAGSQDEWKGKVVRVGHMGSITPNQVKDLLNDIESML